MNFFPPCMCVCVWLFIKWVFTKNFFLLFFTYIKHFLSHFTKFDFDSIYVGTISVVEKLDRETTSQYNLLISATDAISDTSSTVNVFIKGRKNFENDVSIM